MGRSKTHSTRGQGPEPRDPFFWGTLSTLVVLTIAFGIALGFILHGGGG